MLSIKSKFDYAAIILITRAVTCIDQSSYAKLDHLGEVLACTSMMLKIYLVLHSQSAAVLDPSYWYSALQFIVCSYRPHRE